MAGRCARALVIDDHPLTGRGVVALLSSHPMLDGTAYAADLAAAQALMSGDGPWLVVVDFWLGAGSSCDWVRELVQSRADARVIVVSADERPSVRALVAATGAHGFIAKSEPATVMTQAVTAVLGGRRWPAQESLPGDADAVGLTPRQSEVLGLVLRGWSNKRIAKELVLSESTVKEHVSAILARLGVSSRAQLIAGMSAPGRGVPEGA